MGNNVATNDLFEVKFKMMVVDPKYKEPPKSNEEITDEQRKIIAYRKKVVEEIDTAHIKVI